MLSVSKQSFSKTLAKLCVAVFCRCTYLRTDRIKRRERQWPRGHPWRCPKLIRRGKHCAYSCMSVSPSFQSFTHRSRYLALSLFPCCVQRSRPVPQAACVFAASRTKSTPQRTKRDNTSCRCIIRSFLRMGKVRRAEHRPWHANPGEGVQTRQEHILAIL